MFDAGIISVRGLCSKSTLPESTDFTSTPHRRLTHDRRAENPREIRGQFALGSWIAVGALWEAQPDAASSKAASTPTAAFWQRSPRDQKPEACFGFLVLLVIFVMSPWAVTLTGTISGHLAP